MTNPSSQPGKPAPRVEQGSARLRNTREDIESAEANALKAAERFGFPPASLFALRLALEEAMTNAFRHGHQTIPDEPIDLQWRIEPGIAQFTIEDRGPGFTPEDVPDPTLDENLERPSGRGIMLMRAYMTEVRFNERGNRVTMVYDQAAEEAKRRAAQD
ncbi:MAG: ATP-binding protein [Phycisphaerales bacterium]|nr:ATP-binding protein [Phycisphaerales bacterium]